MMRPAVGTDIVYIPRIESRLAKTGADRFLARILTADELDYCADRAERIAGFYAAKEAFAKALGTGIWGKDGVDFKEIILSRDRTGKPHIRLIGKAASAAHARGVIATDVSISHDGDYATAICIMLMTTSHESDTGYDG